MPVEVAASQRPRDAATGVEHDDAVVAPVCDDELAVR
jgi:hypothetical protein